MSISPPPLPRIKSPCRKICRIDPATRMCEGCGRSMAEISNWLRMTEAERDAIMAELPARRARLGYD